MQKAGGRTFAAARDARARLESLIRTTRIAGGLLLGYNPWKAGARLKTPAFTLFRPHCP